MSEAASPRPDDSIAGRLRGFGPLGLLAIAAIVAVHLVSVLPAAILVLVWAWRSRTPWPELGYVRPRSFIGTAALGLFFGIAFKLLMKAIVMPLLGAPAVNAAYHYLAGNRGALPGILFAVIVGAGFAEETVFRGYFFERLGKLFGVGTGAKVAIVLLTTAWFGLAHYHDHGLAGVEQALVTGLAFGSVFAVSGRIWGLIFAHAAFDVTAVAIIYWDVESRVAHLVFR